MQPNSLIYDEMLSYFGSVENVANYYDTTPQAVYQWRQWVPVLRVREFKLLRKWREAESEH